jgi:predicted small metal-binding protein
MSKVLRCTDIMPGCDFVARGERDVDVLIQAAEHASHIHNVKRISPALASALIAALRDDKAPYVMSRRARRSWENASAESAHADDLAHSR